jgi:hypothetical protein
MSFSVHGVPVGYMSQFATTAEYSPAANAGELCATVVKQSICQTASCGDGVDFALAPYRVGPGARLALQASSSEFMRGVASYNECVRAATGTEVAIGPNKYI